MSVNFTATIDTDFIYIYNYDDTEYMLNRDGSISFEYVTTSNKNVKLVQKIYPLDTNIEKYNFKFKISEYGSIIRCFHELYTNIVLLKEQTIVKEQDFQNNIGYYSSVFQSKNNANSTNENFNINFSVDVEKNKITISNIVGLWEGDLFFQYSYDTNDYVLWSNKKQYYGESNIVLNYSESKLLSIRAIDSKNNYKIVNIEQTNVITNRPISSISNSNKLSSSNTGFGGSAGQLNSEYNTNTPRMGSGNPNSAITDFLSVLQYIQDYFDLGDKMSKCISIGSVFTGGRDRKEFVYENMEKLFEYTTSGVHKPYSSDVENIHKIFETTTEHVNKDYLIIKPKNPDIVEYTDKEEPEYKRQLLNDVFYSNVLMDYEFFEKSKNLYTNLLTIFSKYAIS